MEARRYGIQLDSVSDRQIALFQQSLYKRAIQFHQKPILQNVVNDRVQRRDRLERIRIGRKTGLRLFPGRQAEFLKQYSPELFCRKNVESLPCRLVNATVFEKRSCSPFSTVPSVRNPVRSIL